MLTQNVFDLDGAKECERIGDWLRQALRRDLHRHGIVVALSGGVDSSVCAALAARALGVGKVLALLLPERDSSPHSTRLGRLVAEQLGIEWILQDITPALEAIGCYSRRDEAIRAVLPDYAADWKSKIAIRGGLEGRINHFVLVVETPAGAVREQRLGPREYLQIVAATSYKQRLRKAIEYFHADRLHYAVLGTPNRLEYDQGFFVKNGDGAADLKPIAHLYKTQVYALARFLGLPDEICAAQPTTDTYSMTQGQDEFYFGLPYADMDLALWGHDHGLPAAELGRALGMEPQQAELVYRDIERKRGTTAYLHASPRLAAPDLGG